MFSATEWMAMPSYIGMDRMLYEPFMRLSQRGFDASSNRLVRGILCWAAGLLRLILCIMPIHLLLRVPTSHIILVLLVVLDIFVHPFGATAESIHVHDTKTMLSVRFLRLLSASQMTMLILMVLFCLHSVRLRLWQYFM